MLYSNCKNFRWLPPLGKLPCLITVNVFGMSDVKYIDDELYGSTTVRGFASLSYMNE
jgi:hypothetical protein